MIFIILLRKSSTPLKVENNKDPIEFLLINSSEVMKLRFEFSTTSKAAQERLGIKK